MICGLKIKRTIEEVKDFPGLGATIRKARESDTRSLSKICRESGISRAYWYQLEAEDLRSPVSEEMIRKIEAALDIDLKILF